MPDSPAEARRRVAPALGRDPNFHRPAGGGHEGWRHAPYLGIWTLQETDPCILSLMEVSRGFKNLTGLLVGLFGLGKFHFLVSSCLEELQKLGSLVRGFCMCGVMLLGALTQQEFLFFLRSDACFLAVVHLVLLCRDAEINPTEKELSSYEIGSATA